MPRVDEKSLAWAIKKVGRMNMAEKESVLDEIYVQQPNFLMSVLVLERMGNTLEQVGVLLDFLLVIHAALQKAGVHLETVTEDEQDRQLNIFIAKVNFTEGLDAASTEKAIYQYINGHDEQLLFAYAHQVVLEAGFLDLQYENSKYLTTCAMNLVNCVAAANLKPTSSG